MENNNDENFQSESIFQSAKNYEENIQKYPEQYSGESNGLFSKLVRTVTEKLNEYDTQKETKKFQETVQNALESDKDTIELLAKCGCKIQFTSNNKLLIRCDKYNLMGTIDMAAEGLDKLDDGAKKIIRILYEVKTGSENMEDCIDKLEAEGFYPVGNLEKKEMMLEGKKCTVLAGTFQNNARETKKLYFYHGKQVFPEE